MTTEVMTIREMCDAFNVTPRTLRFYEAKELLFPIREGQKRIFTRRDKARLTLILNGKKYGISLEELRQLLDIYDQDSEGGLKAQERASLDAFQRRHQEMKEQKAALETVMEDLAASIEALEETVASHDKN